MNRNNLLLSLLLAVSLILRLIHLNFPNQFYFDENYTAFTAQAIAKKNSLDIWTPSVRPIDPPRGYEWSHPPLARLTIAVAIKILGNKPWVWRLPSVVAGILSLLLTYAVGKHLFSKTTGIIAAFLFSFDGLHFASSRIATIESLLVCLILASLYLASRRHLYLSAFAAGMAIATKWVALIVIPLIILFYRYKNPKTSPIHTLLILIALPSFIYAFSYLFFFTVGFNLSDFISLQITMFTHSLSIEKIHPFASPWYLWPLGLQPIPYFAQAGKELWALPNFLIFWLGLASITLCIASGRRRSSKAIKLTFTSYLAFLLPWILLSLSPWKSRTTYLYYYLPALPFLHLLSAYWLSRGLKKPGLARTATLVTLAMIPPVFFAIYPRLVGL